MMREMERTSAREKERMQELLKSSEAYYSDMVEKLKAKIVSLERERNILTNSVRQQASFKSISKSQNLHHQQETEYTSFWLDSGKEEDEVEEDPIKLERSNSLGEETAERTGDDKNNEEILEQIRNIMGKLDMSGIIDEDDEDDEEQEKKMSGRKQPIEDNDESSMNQRSLNSEFRKIIERLNSDEEEEEIDESRRMFDESLLGNGEHAIDDDIFRHS